MLADLTSHSVNDIFVPPKAKGISFPILQNSDVAFRQNKLELFTTMKPEFLRRLMPFELVFYGKNCSMLLTQGRICVLCMSREIRRRHNFLCDSSFL